MIRTRSPAISPLSSVYLTFPLFINFPAFSPICSADNPNRSSTTIRKSHGQHSASTVSYTWPQLQGLRVFELHQEHGLQVHLATNQFVDVNRARELATKAGWGRIHVTRMPREHAGYVAKYLSKERPECLYRWRLWAGFGKGWEWTRVKDIIRETLFSRIYRACREWKG